MVHKEIGKNKSVEWLSKTPQDSNVIVRTSPHLAETQPHNDQNFIFVRQRFNQF
jgi:hypothetical protein